MGMKGFVEANGPLEGVALWRRQCARNVMDCYALGMEAVSECRESGGKAGKALEGLTRLMVEGMTAVKDAEDEKAFYRMAARACRECEAACRGENKLGDKAGLFRIYSAIFEDMSGEGGRP
jgi:hypothetical protein